MSTLLALLLTYGLLLWYLKPSLLFKPTITGGGDTIAHYVAARYLRDYLLPNGKLIGWMPGNLAGYPLFLFYFPLAFLLIAGFSLVVSFPIAFKLGTIAGTFGLPIASLVALRWIGCPFPIPALGAVLTLPFLLNAGNSMWGGNIPSTLAGEFSHSLSLTLLVLFMGALYRGVLERRYAGWCAVLFALTGLAHGYGMVMAAGMGLYFLAVTSEFRMTLLYLVRVYAVGGLLLGFWLIPLVWYLPYTTGFSITWEFTSILEIVPVVLWPIIVIAAVTVALTLRGKFSDKGWLRMIYYLTYPVVLSVTLYFVSPWLNLVDVRFLAFAQFFLVLLAAAGLGGLLMRLPRSLWRAAPVVIAVMTIAWVMPQVSFIPKWIQWNFSGMEQTPWWRYFIVVNSIALPGGPHSPRVVYQHSVLHDKAGTIRAFEALPLISGRPTLEGAYMQSSPTSPFVFYIQSELTDTPSCPFVPYKCSPFDPERALAHLELFNVKEVIAVTDRVKAALGSNPGYREEGEIGPYKIFQVRQGNGQYVVPLRYQPALVTDGDWKRLAYDWFQKPEWLEVPLLFPRPGDPVPPGVVPFRDLMEEPVKQVLSPECHVKDALGNEEVRFETECPGRPHLIKVSYHPKWRVEGADRIYLVSPSFMLVYPTAKQVRLVFGNRWPDYVGRVATAAGIALLLAETLVFLSRKRYSSLENPS
ncbi:6-pyruvoyl-tetrahydropterin synthase-related protein [Candidatus Methylomirabilis limnetica]|uniref:6-pyruvoyl-tetrahydropterin synthase-related protein n=1 Tax=Candidatus Methylomirabilis limnetica TaxID=2033718 RepID=UPI00137AA129|nr:6-pyruvoyl-tetrahydropterin synthase-related protein [Candidatus Methylomirabilis limnetica]